jgi:hypothetical protein
MTGQPTIGILNPKPIPACACSGPVCGVPLAAVADVHVHSAIHSTVRHRLQLLPLPHVPGVQRAAFSGAHGGAAGAERAVAGRGSGAWAHAARGRRRGVGCSIGCLVVALLRYGVTAGRWSVQGLCLSGSLAVAQVLLGLRGKQRPWPHASSCAQLSAAEGAPC